MAKTSYLKWIITITVPFLLYFSLPQNVSPEFPTYMALTSAAILAWAFNIYPAVGVAAMLTFAYMLFGVADAETVFGPWATVLPWLSFAAVIIGDAMEESQLARRLALFCLKNTGGSFTGLTIGFFIAGLVLVLILPSILARCVIFCAIASGIIQALNIDPKSRLSSALILMAFFTAAAPQFMYLHSSESFIWAFDIMLKGTDKTVNFWDYCYHGTLINLVYYAVSMACVYIVKGREKLPISDRLTAFIAESRAELGPLSTKEIKLFIIVLGIIAGFMLQPWTGIDPVYLFCALSLCCYLPGISILTPESFNKLNVVFLIFVAGCMAIGFVGGSVGANKWAVDGLVAFLQGTSSTMSVFFAYIAGVVVNFLLTPFAATAAFTPAIGELGNALNVNPLPLFYSLNFGLDQYLFPYEAVYFLYIFITEKITLRHIVFALFVRILLTAVFLIAVAIPYWKMIDLL